MRVFCYIFAIELLLRGQFSASVQDENVVFRRYFVPFHRTVCSESSKLSCSTHVLDRAENLVAFQFFKNPAILL